jgi:hypothetical protein
MLLLAAVGGMLAVMPYVFALFGEALGLTELPMPLPVFIAVQAMQTSIVFAMVIVPGLLLAPRVGVRMPLLEAWLYGARPLPADAFRVPTLAGLAVGVVTVILLFLVFLPRIFGWPWEAGLPIWMRLLVCIYGAVNEELLMRLFLLSLVLWLLQKIGRTAVRSSPVLFWSANIVVALLFGAAYLPAAAKVIELTPFAIFSIIFVKAGAGLVFGWLCWVRGLEAAMIAHFAADLVLHVIAPMFLEVPVTV